MRTLNLALVVLTLAGCKKDPAPPAVKTAPLEAPAPKVEAFAVPTALTTLSVFEPVGPGCEWRQLEPVAGTMVVLATFPGACVGARVAWSPDASKAVVWFDPEHVQSSGYSTQVSSKPGYPDETVDPKASRRAFVVSTLEPQVEPLLLPAFPKQALRDLGVDATGAVLALLEEELPDGATGVIESNGEKFDLGTITEGIPVLVHAYRRDGAKWVRAETKLSSTGWDYGNGVRELDAHQKLGPRSDDLAASHAQGDTAEGEVLKDLAALAPKGAGEDDGSWIFLGAGGTRFYVWEVTGEFAHTTGLVVNGKAALPKLGFTDGDLVAIRTSGAHVLISAANVGTHPRLYAMPEGTLVFSSDTARAASFWPTTAKPESHETP